jgi:primosomal protein N' (replication factor Y)
MKVFFYQKAVSSYFKIQKTLQTFFADILLPVPIKGTFTYRVPFELNDFIKEGVRVVVQFGRKKIYTGIVVKLHEQAPNYHDIKYVLSVLDENTVVNNIQLNFWKWISDYYMCSQGEVMHAAVPSAFKLASESKVVLHPDYDGNEDNLTDKEFLILEALEMQKVLTLTEVSKIVDQLKVVPLIKTMIEKRVVLMEEELKDRYKPKTTTWIKLNDEYLNDEKLAEVFKALEKRAFKQLELLMNFIRLADLYNPDSNKEVERSVLLSSMEGGDSSLRSLIKKEILQAHDKTVSRLKDYDQLDKVENIKYSEAQEEAWVSINKEFESKSNVLLHGVTGSGKTEIYIRLIQEVLNQGKQVLYLLPEIALTTQIINRLRKYFGNQVGVYHSKYNEFERVEIWNAVNAETNKLEQTNTKYSLILGARSSMFLPYNNLGLIIIDEEHDTSYKQINPAPRYNARDAAILLAHLHGAKVLLGTATPSIESYYNAKSGKYGYVELTKRFGGIQLPEILVADIKQDYKKRRMKSIFSPLLIQHMEAAFENKEQVILFQNRRGFSTRIECKECNWVPTCKNCDVSLTYHKHINLLKCHYCGYSTHIPDTCPECESQDIFMKGFGTEKIEEEIKLLYPEIRVKRMDLDTTKSKYAHQQIISDFEDRKTDVLVGTQMITKGLDFDNVSVVGILNADSMISFPDFRSFERSFQLISQVSGRAGRKNKRGKVIIQSYNPYHSVIRYAIDNNYLAMFDSQILDRRNFKYPPFYRLVHIKMKHQDAQLLKHTSWKIAEDLRKEFGNLVLGPEYPLVSRINNYYIKQIMIKIPKTQKLQAFKNRITKRMEVYKKDIELRKLTIQIDVDPL